MLGPSECLDQDDNLGGSPHYLIKTLELYEVANRFMVSRSPDYNDLSASLSSPPLRKTSDDFDTVMQLDQCLVRWERDLPEDLRLIDSRGVTMGQNSNAMHRQSVVIRLR